MGVYPENHVATIEEDRYTLARLLEILRYETLNYLNPGEDIEEMVRNDDKSHVNLWGRLVRRGLPATPQAKRQGGIRERSRERPYDEGS